MRQRALHYLEKVGIADNDWVEVHNDNGVVVTRANVSCRIPRGVAHQNVGHGTNIEITIYARKPLKRLCPLDAVSGR